MYEGEKSENIDDNDQGHYEEDYDPVQYNCFTQVKTLVKDTVAAVIFCTVNALQRSTHNTD